LLVLGSDNNINGVGHAKLLESSVISVGLYYNVVWIKDKIDLQDLAIKRWIDRLSMEDLAKHFNCGRTTIIRKLAYLRKNPDFVEDGRARAHIKIRR
jgi:hypothetical protein